MIITWRGLGFLALLTWLVPWMAVWGYTTELWPLVLGHIGSISLTYAVGRMLNRNKVRHYLYDIRFEYSGFVLSGICAVLYIFFQFLGSRAPHSVPPPEKPSAEIGMAVPSMPLAPATAALRLHPGIVMEASYRNAYHVRSIPFDRARSHVLEVVDEVSLAAC